MSEVYFAKRLVCTFVGALLFWWSVVIGVFADIGGEITAYGLNLPVQIIVPLVCGVNALVALWFIVKEGL